MAISYTLPPVGAVAFTINETCSTLRVGRDKVYSLITSGDLKSVKLGKRTLIPAASVRGYLSSIGLELAA